MVERATMSVREWLGALGVACAGSQRAEDARVKSAALTPLMHDAFPPEAFCYPSLRYCAERAKFWPTFHELHGWLGEWWAENRPKPKALAGPGSTDAMTPVDQLWLGCWHRRIAEINAGRSADGRPYGRHDNPEDARRTLASLVRQQSPAAWSVIAGGAT